MSLVSIIESLQKRPLTKEEVANVSAFQKHFDVDDEDPLIVVLALMARSQLIVDAIPNLLQQKVAETIELHRVVLRDQAVLISKELIADLTHHIESVNANWMAQWIRYAGFFAGGIISSACACAWILHLAH